MKTEVITVAQVPILVRAAQPEPETIYLDPTAQNIFLGGSDVTTSTGVALTKSLLTPIYVRGGQTLYAITATGSHPLIMLCESP